jgi:MarR family transcriptional regulator, transcriptional regulator for hemolysin
VTHANGLPIGLHLNQAARVVGQQFDRALTEAGGSLPIWLVLLSLASGQPATQRALAGTVGISEATLSHHLNSLEIAGLVTRTRNTSNRRVHDVAVTDEGRNVFRRLRTAAEAFDATLNHDLSQQDQAQLAELLDRVVANVSDRPRPVPAWAGVGASALAAREQATPSNLAGEKEGQ